MIRTLTPNPAVDRTVTAERFAVDRVNRIGSDRREAGGKGINVARVLRTLGAEVLALAPAAGAAGGFLGLRLTEEGIPHRLLGVAGETRTNLKIVDPVSGTFTDLNEPGSVLSARDLEALGALAVSDLGPGDWVVFSGSLPPGAPPDLYARWGALVRDRGGRWVLDTSGEALARGLEARPDLVKPNRAELEAWAGTSLETGTEVVRAAGRMAAAGAGAVAVSLGPEGVLWTDGRELWKAAGLPVEVRSTSGAGDALVAGLVWALARGLPPAEALVWGAAAATASVARSGPGAGTKPEIEAFARRITARRA